MLSASHKTFNAVQEGCAAAGALGWEGHAQELGATLPKLVEDSSALAAAIKQVTSTAVGCMPCRHCFHPPLGQVCPDIMHLWSQDYSRACLQLQL